MELFLFLGILFLFTFLGGFLLEKIKIPGIFSALILGLLLAFNNPFEKITSSLSFEFLAWLGMYFLLFLIGFELDLEKIKKLGRFIFKATFSIILFEAMFGSLLVHFLFNYSWPVSILIALSFATVGEAILIPILDEFQLTKTRLGQSILGVGALDDVIEVFVIMVAVLSLPLLGAPALESKLEFNRALIILFSLFVLFLFTFVIIALKKRVFQSKIKNIDRTLFLLVFSILFLFVGFGKTGEVAAIGALLAGVAIKNFLPPEKLSKLEPEIKTISYGFLGPIFFFWVGVDINPIYLISAPLLVLLIVGITYGAKILASFLVGKKELGKKEAILMGIALGARLSTSVVIVKFFFEKNLIGSNLYSLLIAATLIFTFLVPFLLSFLIKKWKVFLF